VDSETLGTLTAISVVAVCAPVLADVLRRFRIAGVVIEILAGILIGPQVLGIAELTPTINSFSSLGLAFLMFLAGYEIDFARIRGAPLRFAASGWGLSLAIGFALGLVLQVRGRAISGLIIGLVLTTTALGTMLPMWRDAGLLRTRFGSHALAIGTVGEFGPIVAITLLLSGHRAAEQTALLTAFTVLAAAVALLAVRPRPPLLVRLLREQLHTSVQLPVRVAVFTIVALLWIANDLGLDVLLGAFAAGIVVRLANTDEDEPIIQTKLEAIGFGFFIPIFFVVSGMQFDLDALLSDPESFLQLPLFLGLFLLVRGLPILLYGSELAPGARWPMVFFSATALPLVVVITQIGTETDRLGADVAAALVGAAMLSVVIFPTTAFTLLRRHGQPRPDVGADADAEADPSAPAPEPPAPAPEPPAPAPEPEE
jgi:Kef-type K+ transport system membrane component KefB